MVARQGHREFVPLVVGKSVSECRNVVMLVMAVVYAKLILLTTALNLKKSENLWWKSYKATRISYFLFHCY